MDKRVPQRDLSKGSRCLVRDPTRAGLCLKLFASQGYQPAWATRQKAETREQIPYTHHVPRGSTRFRDILFLVMVEHFQTRWARGDLTSCCEYQAVISGDNALMIYRSTDRNRRVACQISNRHIILNGNVIRAPPSMQNDLKHRDGPLHLSHYGGVEGSWNLQQ
jgi:hypothetical protein